MHFPPTQFRFSSCYKYVKETVPEDLLLVMGYVLVYFYPNVIVQLPGLKEKLDFLHCRRKTNAGWA